MIRPEIALWLRSLEFTNDGKMIRWKATVALICKNAKILNLDRDAREDEVYSLVRNHGLKTIPGGVGTFGFKNGMLKRVVEHYKASGIGIDQSLVGRRTRSGVEIPCQDDRMFRKLTSDSTHDQRRAFGACLRTLVIEVSIHNAENSSGLAVF